MINNRGTIFSRAINIVVIVVMIITINNSPDKSSMLILGSILFILIKLIGNKIADKNILKQRLILYAVNTLIISGIVALDTTGISIILFLVQVGEIVTNNSFMVGVSLTIANYMLYLIIVFIRYNVLDFYRISVITIDFAVTYILISGIRNEIIEKRKAQATAKELETKTMELKKAYEKLQELYEEKEEVILLKEKNRIAGEIHDTVGHILTSVVIELEASKRLIKKDSNLALEKLNLAQQQVKNGLDDIRKSVRTFKEGGELIDFVSILKAFIREVEKNAEVEIEYNFSEIPKLDKKVENIIYRSLQEGITNGIRHGNSKKFQVELNYEDEKIKFTIKDFGKGFEELKLGFGLYNMKSKVEAAGGIFKINSAFNEGVKIYIEIPVMEVI